MEREETYALYRIGTELRNQYGMTFAERHSARNGEVKDRYIRWSFADTLNDHVLSIANTNGKVSVKITGRTLLASNYVAEAIPQLIRLLDKRYDELEQCVVCGEALPKLGE